MALVTFHMGAECYILWLFTLANFPRQSSKSKLAKVNNNQGYSCHPIKCRAGAQRFEADFITQTLYCRRII